MSTLMILMRVPVMMCFNTTIVNLISEIEFSYQKILAGGWRLPSRPIICIGLVCPVILYTGVGTILWFALLNSAGVMYASLVSYMAPVIAVILGVLILSEKFTWQLLVGGALVLCGVMWVNSGDTQKT